VGKIGTQNTMPYFQKYTPTDCFLASQYMVDIFFTKRKPPY